MANTFTPTNYSSVSASSTGNTVAVPGGAGTALSITNLGPSPAAIVLGTVSNPTQPLATSSNGVVVMPGKSISLGVGANTFISATAIGFGNAQLNLAQGTWS